MYICPKCSEKLIKIENSFKCPAGHTYDVSAKGYVNLLLSSKKRGSHGDNKEMITARRRFLSLDHYSIIIDKLCDIIADHSLKNSIKSPKILDAGCGEGYYCGRIYDRLCRILSDSPIIYALDVSKDAVGLASKSYKCIDFSVSSINKLPFPDNSFDVVLSLFAPLSETEFNRVLKRGGLLITVSPSEDHLLGLKKIIYDTPYKNPPSTFVPEILAKIDEEIITGEMTLKNNDEVTDLFSMTPYYYNTSDKDKEKLKTVTNLKTEIGFVFGIFKKEI